MGLTLEDLFPGRFLRSHDFKGKPVTVTMVGVELEELPSERGEDETKGIISLRETKKKWVINRTNAECLKAMFGKQCDDWKNKQVTLYPEKVRFGKETVDGIRVKGSPDIKEPLAFDLKLPRKKPVQVKLVPTPRRDASAPDAAAVIS